MKDGDVADSAALDMEIDLVRLQYQVGRCGVPFYCRNGVDADMYTGGRMTMRAFPKRIDITFSLPE